MSKFAEKMERLEATLDALRRLAAEAPELMERIDLILLSDSPAVHFWGSYSSRDKLRGIVSKEARDWGWRRVGGSDWWEWICRRHGIEIKIQTIEARETGPKNGGLVEFPPVAPIEKPSEVFHGEIIA